MEGKTHAEHAGLLEPGLDRGLRIRRFGIEAPHDCKTVGVFFDGFGGEVVAIAFPGWRHDDDAVNAGAIHVLEQLFMAERDFALRMRASGPGPFRCIGAPDVYL